MKVSEFKKIVNIIYPKQENSTPYITFLYTYEPDGLRIEPKQDEILIIINYYREINKDLNDNDVLLIIIKTGLKNANFPANEGVNISKISDSISYLNTILTLFDDLIEVVIFDGNKEILSLSNSPKFNSHSESSIEYCLMGDDFIKTEINDIYEEIYLKNLISTFTQINCNINPPKDI